MTNISATIVADSKAPSGDRLTTMLVTFPRFILAELNTHRMLSKNSASSRAIPFEKLLEKVQNDPFIPIAWQKDHKGMQGTDYFTEAENYWNIDKWLKARDSSIKIATQLNEDTVTKQLCNRLLEPFMWHTVLISGTEWENFFNLRCPTYQVDTDIVGKSRKDIYKLYADKYKSTAYLDNFTELDWLKVNKGQAEIHMMALAESMWDAMNESTPKQLKAGEWHIPFEDKIDTDSVKDFILNNLLNKGEDYGELEISKWYAEVQFEKVKISTAMAARTSYTIVGDEKEFGYEKQIELHDRLTTSGHYSPFEHCARVMSQDEWEFWTKGKLIPGFDIPDSTAGWCRNYRGFIQYREILENAK